MQIVSNLPIGRSLRPDIVGFANAPARQTSARGVVFDIKPIADIHAKCRKPEAPRGRHEDHMRDQLPEMVWPVIVGAVGEQRRKPVGFAPGTYDDRSGLSSRIGRGGRMRRSSENDVSRKQPNASSVKHAAT